ncbi:hypothetical protein SAMN04488109_5393 [Chryseolinea serpens]|uniref:Uncharacterized protein n=1 Tax=Chryseolinea serpens TaxID=947013 RepID=A0A1M5VTF6_9BACT|nr:hypothetical protein SAMN04488109_5393 [Chryseolinea serpens]
MLGQKYFRAKFTFVNKISGCPNSSVKLPKGTVGWPQPTRLVA